MVFATRVIGAVLRTDLWNSSTMQSAHSTCWLVNLIKTLRSLAHEGVDSVRDGVGWAGLGIPVTTHGRSWARGGLASPPPPPPLPFPGCHAGVFSQRRLQVRLSLSLSSSCQELGHSCVSVWVSLCSLSCCLMVALLCCGSGAVRAGGLASPGPISGAILEAGFSLSFLFFRVLFCDPCLLWLLGLSVDRPFSRFHVGFGACRLVAVVLLVGGFFPLSCSSVGPLCWLSSPPPCALAFWGCRSHASCFGVRLGCAHSSVLLPSRTHQTTKRPNDQTTKRPNNHTTTQPHNQTTKPTFPSLPFPSLPFPSLPFPSLPFPSPSPPSPPTLPLSPLPPPHPTTTHHNTSTTTLVVTVAHQWRPKVACVPNPSGRHGSRTRHWCCSAPQRAPLPCVAAARAHSRAACSRRKAPPPRVSYSLAGEGVGGAGRSPTGTDGESQGVGDGELPALPALGAEASISIW